RQALIEEEARAQRDEEEDVSRQPRRSRRYRRGDRNGNRVEKRRGPDPTLTGAYAGEASSDAADRIRPEAEGEEAGLEPFERERAAGAGSLAPPDEPTGARVQETMTQADSIPESGPLDRVGEVLLVDAAAQSATVLAGEDT